MVLLSTVLAIFGQVKRSLKFLVLIFDCVKENIHINLLHHTIINILLLLANNIFVHNLYIKIYHGHIYV